MDPMDLPHFLRGWEDGRGPLYQRLASRIRECIRRGNLGAGARVPSERDLARSLGISRTTVVAAYGMLRDEGLLESARGSGTRVAGSNRGIGPATPPADLSFVKLPSGSSEDVIDCSISVIPGLDGVPGELLAVSPSDVRGLMSTYTYDYLGLPPLRAAIAARFEDLGLPTTPDEVLVTTGAQQALLLLFSLFGRDGGTILVENPTYLGALDAARVAGAKALCVPVDVEGARVRYLHEALERSRARLVYLMTSAHNPTGAIMSDARRREVAELAEAAGAPIVDDMTLGDLAFDRRPPSVWEWTRPGSVIHVGSMSKVFWPGLRIGWIRAPASLIGRLVRLKMVSDLGSCHLSQVVAARLLPLLDEVSASRTTLLADRLEIFEKVLQERLPTWSWIRPAGGPFLWVRIPHGDAEIFSHVALRHGVHVLPGRRMSTDESFLDHLRISYVADPALLEVAVERLAEAWERFSSADGVSRLAPQVAV